MKQGNWKSRKLFVALAALIVEVVLAFGVDPEVANDLGQLVMAIASAYIVGQSVADARAQ